MTLLLLLKSSGVAVPVTPPRAIRIRAVDVMPSGGIRTRDVAVMPSGGVRSVTVTTGAAIRNVEVT